MLYSQDEQGRYTRIDANKIKETMPGYTPDQAPAFHEDSGYLTEEVVIPAATEGGQHNVILDVTGKNPDTLAAPATHLKSKGYTIEANLTQLPTEKALVRSYNRLFTEGRYVPPDYIAGVGDKPQSTFDRLQSEGLIDKGSIFDTDVPRREPPRLVKSWIRKSIRSL